MTVSQVDYNYMGNNILFRNAKHEDALEVANVLVNFYNMENIEEAITAFNQEIKKDYRYIIAIENEKIIGLVTWLIHGLPKHGLFELDRICILEESRGKGIGRILKNALIEDARKWYSSVNSSIRKLYLLTHEDNKPAHKFYEKVGFTHETTLKNHYYNNKDERVYSIFFSN